MTAHAEPFCRLDERAPPWSQQMDSAAAPDQFSHQPQLHRFAAAQPGIVRRKQQRRMAFQIGHRLRWLRGGQWHQNKVGCGGGRLLFLALLPLLG